MMKVDPLSRLAIETCRPDARIQAPDLRIGPTLPSAAVVEAAGSFEDLEAIGRRFEESRGQHDRRMHVAAVPAVRERERKGSGSSSFSRASVPASAYASASASASASAPEDDVLTTHTFAGCVLALADPSSQVLSRADATRCLRAFVNKAAGFVDRDRRRVAVEYHETLDRAERKATSLDDVLESLRDAEAVFSDVGLHDAAILSLARTLRVTLVVRVSSPSPSPSALSAPPTYGVFLGFPQLSQDAPAALVGWDEAARAYVVEEAPTSTLRGIREKIVRSSGLGPTLRDARGLGRMTLPELRTLASRVALGSHPTKASIISNLVTF